MRLDIPPLWRGVPKLIYAFRDRYEPELRLLDTLLSPGSAVVDAGASLGIYTMVAASIAGPSGRILAIEPARDSRRWLKRNVSLNGATNVDISGVALWDRVGTARLIHHPDPGRASLVPTEGGDDRDAEDVSTAPLDRVMVEYGWTRLDLLKVDVEGAEEPLLQGARQTLEAFRPVVIVEFNPASAHVQGGDGASRVLGDAGYRLLAVDRQTGMVKVARPGMRWGNVIGVHASDGSALERLGVRV